MAGGVGRNYPIAPIGYVVMHRKKTWLIFKPKHLKTPPQKNTGETSSFPAAPTLGFPQFPSSVVPSLQGKVRQGLDAPWRFSKILSQMKGTPKHMTPQFWGRQFSVV